jgi:hypothetical protein
MKRSDALISAHLHRQPTPKQPSNLYDRKTPIIVADLAEFVELPVAFRTRITD